MTSKLSLLASNPSHFGLSVLKAAWGVSENETRDILRVLVDRGLVEVVETKKQRYWIHDLLIEHARDIL